VKKDRDVNRTARDIVMRHGFNATAYQILNPGIEHWIMSGEAAVVGFVRQEAIWVVAGAPVCAPELLSRAAEAFEREAARHDARVCYACAATRLNDLMAGREGYSTIAIGAEPVWQPQEWQNVVRAHPGIRSQLRRAINKGVSVTRWDHPSPEQFAELENVLRAWLASRPLPTLHFLTGADALGAGVADRLLMVAERGGEIVAFLLASPIPQRNGYLVEQVIRRPKAPNGTAELLIDAAIQHMSVEGCTHVTLGLVALARHASAEMRLNPPWLRFLMSWARAHGRRFYHFDGLEMFRTKLAPVAWEPIYAISNEPHFSPTTLYALAAAFTEGKPLQVLAAALAGAVKREAGWLLHPPQRSAQSGSANNR
jgi:phosphatidylglycerol lysyltransferase